MTCTLIQNVHLVNAFTASDTVTDVGIVEGWVRFMTPQEEPDRGHRLAPPRSPDFAADQVIDGTGLFLGPGLVDLYSQSGEPGHESRETLASLRAAAAAGGFTRVGILPNTVPVMDDPAQITHQLQQHAPQQPTLLLWGACTQAAQGQQLTDLMALAAAGIVGFCDGQPLPNPRLLRSFLDYVQPLRKPIALWPCDRTLTGEGLVREGADAIRLGLPSVAASAETVPLAAILEQVAEALVPVHLMRISTARGVALIQDAKARGLPITASVSWLHLLLSTADLGDYDPNLRLTPPLGTPKDQQALIVGLEEGALDAIAIDHQAYTYEEKTVAFGDAPAGAIGLELALPLLWQSFVTPGRWSPAQLWRYLSTQPAQCLGLSVPKIAVDQPAEMILFDPQQSWQVSPQTLQSLASNTPWLNQTLQGKVIQSWMP